MKYRFLLLLTILCSTSAFSQTNYKPGYVVTLNGDTVKGFIDYREWDKNPKTFLFKKDQADKKQEYSAANVKGFGVNGFESYRRYAGQISQDKLNIEGTKSGLDTSKIIDTVFFRVINAAGPLTLYGYKDLVKQRFFIKDNDNAPVELIFHEYYKSNGDQNIIITEHGFRMQLTNLAVKYRPNDNSISTQLQRTEYEESALNKIVTEINGHADNQKRDEQIRGGARFFAGIAANSSVISYSSGIGLSNDKGTSVFPKLGIGADLFINKNVRSIVFRGELYFTANHQNISASSPAYDGHNYTDIEEMKFNQFIISFNPQILYNFYNTDNIKVYIAGGVAFNYNGYSKKEYHVTFDYGGGLTGPVPRDFPDLQATNFNITAKIGCELNKKIGIFAGVSPSSRLNDDFNYGVYLTSYYAGVNYFFGK